MKKLMTALTFCFSMLPVASSATVPLDFALAQKAVELSAVVDAYGEYCKKHKALGDGYIARFKEAKLEEKKISELRDLQKNSYSKTLETLKTEKKDCKDVQFLLKRLEIMRSLKDVSYEINGIDPATVKDNIPTLEMLAPEPTEGTMPSDLPQEPEKGAE